MSNATSTQLRTEDPATPAREYAQQRRAFQIHLMVASISTALVFIINWFTNAISGITGEVSAWWSVWMLVGWGFALMIHGILVMAAKPQDLPSA